MDPPSKKIGNPDQKEQIVAEISIKDQIIAYQDEIISELKSELAKKKAKREERERNLPELRAIMTECYRKKKIMKKLEESYRAAHEISKNAEVVLVSKAGLPPFTRADVGGSQNHEG